MSPAPTHPPTPTTSSAAAEPSTRSDFCSWRRTTQSRRLVAGSPLPPADAPHHRCWFLFCSSGFDRFRSRLRSSHRRSATSLGPPVAVAPRRVPADGTQILRPYPPWACLSLARPPSPVARIHPNTDRRFKFIRCRFVPVRADSSSSTRGPTPLKLPPTPAQYWINRW